MAPLIALIHYMDDNKIITKPTQTETPEAEENDKQVLHLYLVDLAISFRQQENTNCVLFK